MGTVHETMLTQKLHVLRSNHSVPSWTSSLLGTLVDRFRKLEQFSSSRTKSTLEYAPKTMGWISLVLESLSGVEGYPKLELFDNHFESKSNISGPECWWLVFEVEARELAFAGQFLALILGAWTAYTLPILVWNHRKQINQGPLRLDERDLTVLLKVPTQLLKDTPDDSKLFVRKMRPGDVNERRLKNLRENFQRLARRLEGPHWAPWGGFSEVVRRLYKDGPSRQQLLDELDNHAVDLLTEILDWDLDKVESN